MNNNPYMSYGNTIEQRKDNGVSDTDLLKLMDILTLHEASALIAGCSPNKVYQEEYNGEWYTALRTDSNDPKNANEVFSISLKAMVKAIEHGLLKANIKVSATTNPYSCYLTKQDLTKDWIAVNGIDETQTTVTRGDLKKWLEQRGVYPTMLFPNGKKDDYMNPNHPHYAPKLAVCVKAWEIAQNANPQGQTYKQFMADWIAKHGADYGLEVTGKKAFDELASISNWDTKGGRASSEPTPLFEPKIDDKEILENLATVHRIMAYDLPNPPQNNNDDDIPF